MFVKILKSTGAILAGFASVAVLSILTDMVMEKTGVFPPQNRIEAYIWWMYLLALVYRTVYTVFGGYLTAVLSPDKPMRNVTILAAIGTAMAVLGAVANWDKTSASSAWYPVLLAVLSFPSVWLGGFLRTKTAR
ncbi:MAG: hypothetical protein HZC28_05200 [Spirochaetes bacterium]|nr:hypothetical protein [Spirochaetota bacterium]